MVLMKQARGPWFEPSALADPKLMIVGVLTEINKFVIRILREYCADYTFAWYREDTQRTLWAATGDETLPIIRASHCNINDGERLPILSFKLECNYIIKGNGLEAAPDHHTVMFTDRGAGRTWEGVLSYVSAKGHSQIISVDDRVETTAFLRDLLVGPSARA